jgi:molecular chaperone GrpE
MSSDQQSAPSETSANPPESATPGQAAQAPETLDPAELTRLLDEARSQSAEHYDQYIRARADMDNVRRRAQEDVSKAHKYAVEAFAESLVPVMDSLEMALKSDAPSIAVLKEGVEATLRQLSSAFEKNKLIELNPVGEKFDPNRHQAISTVPVAATQPPVAANHVVSVLQKGYLINDRVLRPALVMVAQG